MVAHLDLETALAFADYAPFEGDLGLRRRHELGILGVTRLHFRGKQELSVFIGGEEGFELVAFVDGQLAVDFELLALDDALALGVDIQKDRAAGDTADDPLDPFSGREAATEIPQPLFVRFRQLAALAHSIDVLLGELERRAGHARQVPFFDTP